MTYDFVTSDHHFTHYNIMKFTNRKYQNLPSMHTDLIGLWNTQIGPNDRVLYLGDFAFHDRDCTPLRKIFSRLNGIKTLVVGNHDDDAVQRLPWHDVLPHVNFKCEEFDFHAVHIPPSVTVAPAGKFILHGHLHTLTPPSFPLFDVGVDANNMKPHAMHDIVHRARDYRMRQSSGLLKLKQLGAKN